MLSSICKHSVARRKTISNNADDRDAEDINYVYSWRLEAEAQLRANRGKGMTDKQVIEFVNGCTSKLMLLLVQFPLCLP